MIRDAISFGPIISHEPLKTALFFIRLCSKESERGEQLTLGVASKGDGEG